MENENQELLLPPAGETEETGVDPQAPEREDPVRPEAADDAGLQTQLRALGVPPEKLERRREALRRRETENPPTPEEERPSLEKLLADPESRRILHDYANGILRRRVKTTGREAAAFRSLGPALEKLAERCGLDPHNADPEELNRRILAGVPEEAPREDPEREEKYRSRFRELRRQEAALRQADPSFDLGAALADPAFARLVAPDSPLGLEDAWFALHRREILREREAAARADALEEAARSLQAGRQRPRESGGSRGVSPLPQLSREQREDLKRRILQAAARGEKIYPT